MLDIRGKWALVTGASRGIGKLAALELARRGCNLILQSRSTEHCEGVKKIAQAFGVHANLVAGEFLSPDSISSMLEQIDEMRFDVDIILNNAGVQVAYRNDPLTTPVSDYKVSFMINTIAPMMICYHFLPKMEKKGFGRIVNTTSGIRLEPEQAGYSASKAALDKVTVDLGSKYEGSDIILSLTDPGWCRTDLGGDKAPNPPESAVPGVVVGAFVNDGHSGRLFSAQDFRGMTLEEAVAKAEGR